MKVVEWFGQLSNPILLNSSRSLLAESSATNLVPQPQRLGKHVSEEIFRWYPSDAIDGTADGEKVKVRSSQLFCYSAMHE